VAHSSRGRKVREGTRAYLGEEDSRDHASSDQIGSLDLGLDGSRAEASDRAVASDRADRGGSDNLCQNDRFLWRDSHDMCHHEFQGLLALRWVYWILDFDQLARDHRG